MKIKTKYNIGDTVIIDSNYGLTLAKVESMYITIGAYDKIPNIRYNLCMVKEGVFRDFDFSEDNILCKATKRNIRKWEENQWEKKN